MHRPPRRVSLRPASFPNRFHFLLIALSFSVSLPRHRCLNHSGGGGGGSGVRRSEAEGGRRAREWVEEGKGGMRRKGGKVVGTGAELSALFIICCRLQRVAWKRGRRWRERGG